MRQKSVTGSSGYKPTTADRIAEMRAYTMLYGIQKLTELGRGFILHQSTRGNWVAAVKVAGREHMARGFDSPASCIRALIDQVEGR